MEIKVCSKCKIEKPLTEFHKKKDSKDGYSYYCKSCKKIEINKSRSKRKEHYKRYNQNLYQKNIESVKKRIRSQIELKALSNQYLYI